jgi:hypothetical protein
LRTPPHCLKKNATFCPATLRCKNFAPLYA